MSKYIPKKYYVKTFGCQANVADSNNLSGILEALGFEGIAPSTNKIGDKNELLEVLPETDVFIVNTCSVRQKSEDKVYGIGKTLKVLGEMGVKKPFIVMAGCMVGSVTGERQRFQFEELNKKTSWVDAYINPSQVFELPNILRENNVLSEWAVKKFKPESIVSKQDSSKNAFVNISYGCDNFCTFCVVPYARGAEVSRSEDEILNEVKHLVARGKTEIMLCGQNVNSWGLSSKEKFKIRSGSKQKLPFAGLLRKVHEINGLEKIDFISSNPFDFTQDLIKTLSLPKMSNYLHIAVQSGNNDILNKMNRRHTIEEFMNLIQNIKKVKPKIEIGTDIIVGFPGETKNQFMETVSLFKKIKFNVAYISMYSQRKGTIAEKKFVDDIPFSEKKRRHAYLTKVWKDSLKSRT